MKKQSTMRASFKNACRGLKYTAMERNFRIELCAGGAAILLGFASKLSSVQWAILITVIGAVLLCESLNTAIEYTIDSVVKEFDPLAGAAKDVAGGASLVAVAMAAAVGVTLFFRIELLDLVKEPVAWISALAYATISIWYIIKAKGREK